MPRATKRSDLAADPTPQDESLLFRLPWHLRRMIYELVFTEEPATDGNYLKGVNEEDLEDTRGDESSMQSKPGPSHSSQPLPNWLRPGCTTRTKIHTELL